MADSQARAPDIPDLSTETDSDLLCYMSWAADADSQAHAREAWAEFYRRHVRYVYGICRRALDALFHSPEALEDLVQDTFRRVFEHAGAFTPGDATDADVMRRHVRAWLGAIVRHLVQDLLRNRQATPPEALLDHEHWNAVESRADPQPPDSPRLALAREVMETALTDEEREVLRVTFQWYDPNRTHQRLPNDVAADVAARLGTTSENLRKIRQRALRKFEAAMRSRMGEPPTTR
jgi:RNA polymerase sigma factor (sigma-70 family)